MLLIAPIVTAGLISAGSNLLGGLFGASAQQKANATNLRIAREQMAFQEGQTAKQMEFQERMSSTAHQREVKDLLAAGLNPMLAIAKASGGASTPAGASGQGASTRVEPVNAMSGLERAANVLGVIRQIKEMELLEAQAYKTREEGTWASTQAHNMKNTFDERLRILRNEGAISQLEFDRLSRLLPLVVPGYRAEIERNTQSARQARYSADLSKMEFDIFKPYVNSGSTIIRTLIPLLRSIR